MKAIIFPGQGAQYTGMGQTLYENFPRAKDIFSSIDKVLGFSLSQKCFYADNAELKETSLQQLAILAVSLAAFEVFRQKNLKVDYLSGLSLGEYSCLYAAEVLSLENLVVLVRKRAEVMQKSAGNNPSTMISSGICKILFTCSSTNAPVQQVAKPNSVNLRRRFWIVAPAC